MRLLLFVILIFGYGTLIPIYIVCWIIIPEARTAAEKLSMHGEAVTVENIGKTVTGGFERMADGVNSYMRSDKPRTLLQRIGDGLVTKAPFDHVLFALGIAFVALLFAAITVAVEGGDALFSLFPTMDIVLPTSPIAAIVMYIAGILLVAIPLFSLLHTLFRNLLKWQPMSGGLKWTLLILWLVSAVVFALCFTWGGFSFPDFYLGREYMSV